MLAILVPLLLELATPGLFEMTELLSWNEYGNHVFGLMVGLVVVIDMEEEVDDDGDD